MKRSVFAVLAAPLLFAGCNKESAPAPEPQGGPAKAGSSAAAAVTTESSGPTGPAQERFSEASFDLKIAPKGSPAAGQASEAEIVLEAKPPFHVNDKYPYKFKVKQTPGVKYAADVVREGVKLEQQRATLTVGYTPEAAGKKRVEGQFSFSVCTEEKCLIEKRDLALDVDVK